MTRRHGFGIAAVVTLALRLAAVQTADSTLNPDMYKQLKFRYVGPARTTDPGAAPIARVPKAEYHTVDIGVATTTITVAGSSCLMCR